MTIDRAHLLAVLQALGVTAAEARAVADDLEGVAEKPRPRVRPTKRHAELAERALQRAGVRLEGPKR